MLPVENRLYNLCGVTMREALRRTGSCPKPSLTLAFRQNPLARENYGTRGRRARSEDADRFGSVLAFSRAGIWPSAIPSRKWIHSSDRASLRP